MVIPFPPALHKQTRMQLRKRIHSPHIDLVMIIDFNIVNCHSGDTIEIYSNSEAFFRPVTKFKWAKFIIHFQQ